MATDMYYDDYLNHIDEPQYDDGEKSLGVKEPSSLKYKPQQDALGRRLHAAEIADSQLRGLSLALEEQIVNCERRRFISASRNSERNVTTLEATTTLNLLFATVLTGIALLLISAVALGIYAKLTETNIYFIPSVAAAVIGGLLFAALHLLSRRTVHPQTHGKLIRSLFSKNGDHAYN
jgi:hypothetical protein